MLYRLIAGADTCGHTLLTCRDFVAISANSEYKTIIGRIEDVNEKPGTSIDSVKADGVIFIRNATIIEPADASVVRREYFSLHFIIKEKATDENSNTPIVEFYDPTNNEYFSVQFPPDFKE